MGRAWRRTAGPEPLLRGFSGLEGLLRAAQRDGERLPGGRASRVPWRQRQLQRAPVKGVALGVSNGFPRLAWAAASRLVAFSFDCDALFSSPSVPPPLLSSLLLRPFTLAIQTMHRCLQIEEILRNVLECHADAPESLVNMALTCRAFYEPAMYIRWRTLRSLEPLMRLLPRHKWDWCEPCPEIVLLVSCHALYYVAGRP